MCLRPTSPADLPSEATKAVTTVRGRLMNLTDTTLLGEPRLIGFLESERDGEVRRTLFSISGDILPFMQEHALRWITEGETVSFYGHQDGRSFTVTGPCADPVRTASAPPRGWVSRLVRTFAPVRPQR